MHLVQQRWPEKPGGRRTYINDEIRGVSSSKSSLPPCIKGITERGTTRKITDHTKRAEWEERPVMYHSAIWSGQASVELFGTLNVSCPSPPFTILNLKTRLYGFRRGACSYKKPRARKGWTAWHLLPRNRRIPCKTFYRVDSGQKLRVNDRLRIPFFAYLAVVSSWSPSYSRPCFPFLLESTTPRVKTTILL